MSQSLIESNGLPASSSDNVATSDADREPAMPRLETPRLETRPRARASRARLNFTLPDTPSRVIVLRPGELLFRAGDRSKHIYYLADGLLRAEHDTPEGIPERLGYFERGTTIGLMFIRIEAFTVVAVRPSRVIAYSPANLSRAIASHSHAAARVSAFATKRLSETLGFLHVCQLREPGARLAAYILFEFDRRATKEGEVEVVELKGTVSDWSELLSIAPEVIAKGFEVLEETKVLKTIDRSHMALLDRRRLEKLAHRAI